MHGRQHDLSAALALLLMLRLWPFLLAKVGEPGFGDDEVRQLFKKLYDEDECCLDPGFALKLKKLAASAEDRRTD